LFTELKLHESIQLDESLLTEAPEDPEANLLAGEILVQQNELEKAEPYLLSCQILTGNSLPVSTFRWGRYTLTKPLPKSRSTNRSVS